MQLGFTLTNKSSLVSLLVQVLFYFVAVVFLGLSSNLQPKFGQNLFRVCAVFSPPEKKKFIQYNTASCCSVEYIGYSHVQALGFVWILTFGFSVESQIKIKFDTFLLLSSFLSILYPRPYPISSACEFVLVECQKLNLKRKF